MGLKAGPRASARCFECRVSRVASRPSTLETTTLGGLKQTRRRAGTDTPEGMNRHAGGYEQTRRRV